MKINSLLAALVGVTLNLGLFGTAHAALQGRDLNGSIDSFEAYYDTDLNITWLADANYGAGSIYDDIGILSDSTTDGRMTWAAANNWAASISFTDGVQVFDNWRLPTVTPVNGISFNFNGVFDGSSDRGHNISEQGTAYAGSTASEMAHLFYNTLDNKSYCPVSTDCSPPAQAGWGLTNATPFTNLQASNYWSGTWYTASSNGALNFSFQAGDQYGYNVNVGIYAMAVSDGDVGISAVPEASTYAMMFAGLALVGVTARRRKQ